MRRRGNVWFISRQFLTAPVADISSSTVREILAYGRPVDEFMPSGVDLKKYI